MLKYMQVKNTDKTEIARFIQFLTSKNYDNIYKRVLNPFNVNDKVFREDLRFVRGYFERLGLYELVKMINNELDIDSWKFSMKNVPSLFMFTLDEVQLNLAKSSRKVRIEFA